MADITVRKEKLQAMRKDTPFRDFLKEICSRRTNMFYKNHDMLSQYPDTPRSFNLVSEDEYEWVREGFLKYGRLYDFEKKFRDNFYELYKEIPLPAIMQWRGNENTKYSLLSVSCKNIYLSFNTGRSENIAYSFSCKWPVSNVFNSVMTRDNSDNVYQSSVVIRSYNIFYSRHISDCANIWFSSDMEWCHECLFCSWLQNQSYCISNIPYPKEEYTVQKKLFLGQKENYFKRYLDVRSHKGTFLFCENVSNASFSYQVRNGRNIVFAGSSTSTCENIYDCVYGGGGWANHCYGNNWAGIWSEHVYLCFFVIWWQNVFYSHYLEHCSYCLACVELKNKEFCILNKQYSKEEWFDLANKIFEKMECEWILWKFFPWWMNPYYFNDTPTYLIDDTFTKEEVEKEWYLRREGEIKTDIAPNAEIVETQALNSYQWFDEQGNRKINPEILKKVIKDEKWNYYRIVPMELDFLQKHGLPLPEIHWLERIKLGFKFK